MPWYPGKFLEKMRQRTRTQYLWLPTKTTPERTEQVFESYISRILNRLKLSIDDVSSVEHELAEISRQLILLNQINEKLGGKYSEAISVLYGIEPVLVALSTITDQLESVHDRLLEQLRTVSR